MESMREYVPYTHFENFKKVWVPRKNSKLYVKNCAMVHVDIEY